MRLEDASAVVLAQLQDAAGPVPTTLAGMITSFGGGTAGKSALAHALADARGIKYESARRNIERYTTEKGTQRRTPKRLLGDLAQVAEQRHSQRLINRAKAGGVTVALGASYIRISNDERPRPPFSVQVSGDDMAAFLTQALGHHWTRAADELNYAVLDAWDLGRGHIVGHAGVITDLDSIHVAFAGGDDDDE